MNGTSDNQGSDPRLDAIVNADKVVDPVPGSSPAPATSNADATKPQPDAGRQPGQDNATDAKQTGATNQPAEEGADKKPKEGQQPEGSDATPEAKLDEKQLADLLGEPEPEPDTVETLAKRYEESSKEAHRLLDDDSAKMQALNELGVEMIKVGIDPKTKKVIYALKPTEKYIQDYTPTFDSAKIFNGLTEQEKDLFDVDPAKAVELVLRKAGSEMVAKRPPVTATEDDKIIDDYEKESIFKSFVSEKMADGKPRFPDADKSEVQEMMGRVYNAKTPEMEALRQAMDKSPLMHKLGLRFMYAEASRILYPMKVASVAARSKQAETIQKNKQEVTISAGGAATSPNAISAKTVQSVQQKMLNDIVNAQF